ncbi:heme/hemin ABC transporter substrate-binding protein [Oceanobacter mangrovi]|uniref:heme/hemin ABC transporter substrate-binding protein n=1 Tax=Oceanobacter mangrovi TaxID=2862510 RepID=UPI001C8D32AE|nr:helical backbone metal receptor [Oceanobacter mangrovi]
MNITLRALLVLGSCLISLLANSAERIVAIDGAITEIIYRLGQQHKLVAVDQSSRYPAAAQQLPDIGYMQFLNVDNILQHRPDLVLMSSEAKPAVVIDDLRDAGVQVVVIDEEISVTGLMNKIERVAELLDVVDAGMQLRREIMQDIEEALALVPQNGKVSVLIARGAGRQNLMVAGRDTHADQLIQLMQASNVDDGYKYHPMDAQLALDAAPEVVILALNPALHQENFTGLFADTPAYRSGRIHVFSEELLLGFGPRLPVTLRELVDVLYPGAVKPVNYEGGAPIEPVYHTEML